MSIYALGIYEKALPQQLSWEEKLTEASRAGYDYLEMSIDETEEKLSRLQWTKAERALLISVMEKTGVPIRSLCLSGHRKYSLGSNEPAIEARSMDIMEGAIALAADLGVRTIQLAGYDVYYEQSTGETAARFLQNLARAVELAAKEGILLGFETMETPFMDTVKKAMEYVNTIDSPYLHVYPDIGNLTNAACSCGGRVNEDLETGKGRIIAVHIKETLPGKYREVPFGTGHVDFKSILNSAWQLGVRRYVTEFWHLDRSMWREDIDFAVSMIRGILDTF